MASSRKPLPIDQKIQAAASEANLGELFVAPGRVSHAEVVRYHALIDLFVVPRTAARVCQLVTPLKPYEAMAMGRCVVAADAQFLCGPGASVVDGRAHLAPGDCARRVPRRRRQGLPAPRRRPHPPPAHRCPPRQIVRHLCDTQSTTALHTSPPPSQGRGLSVHLFSYPLHHHALTYGRVESVVSIHAPQDRCVHACPVTAPIAIEVAIGEHDHALRFNLFLNHVRWYTTGLSPATDRKSTRLNSSHVKRSRMPSSA